MCEDQFLKFLSRAGCSAVLATYCDVYWETGEHYFELGGSGLR